MPTREDAINLLHQHVESEALRHHMKMVAAAMEAYAQQLGEDADLWYMTGLLHDLDWEKYPDEHPVKAVNEFLVDYPEELRQAILAHAPQRSGVEPQTLLDRYLFACDELSGFLHAYHLMRPTGFQGMKPNKVLKRMKDKLFAAGVSREDIYKGFELIGKPPEEHIAFLIQVFQGMEHYRPQK